MPSTKTRPLRAEDRLALRHAAEIATANPGMRLRLGWLRDRIGCTWDEVLSIRKRCLDVGVWQWEDDYRKPSSRVKLVNGNARTTVRRHPAG